MDPEYTFQLIKRKRRENISVKKAISSVSRIAKEIGRPSPSSSLFEQGSYSGFKQDAPVMLSDGKSMMELIFISIPGNKTSSDVAALGVRLVSIKQDLDNTDTEIVDFGPKRCISSKPYGLSGRDRDDISPHHRAKSSIS